MSNPPPKELDQARELMNQAKFNEALEIIEKFEKIESITQEDQLSMILIKGGIMESIGSFSFCYLFKG